MRKQRLLSFTECAVYLGPPPKTKFHFILPAIKSNVNRISFIVG